MKKTYFSGGPKVATLSWKGKETGASKPIANVDIKPVEQSKFRTIGQTVVRKPNRVFTRPVNAYLASKSQGNATSSARTTKPKLDKAVTEARQEFKDILGSINTSFKYSADEHPSHCHHETETHDKFRAPPPDWPKSTPTIKSTSQESPTGLNKSKWKLPFFESETHAKYKAPPTGYVFEQKVVVPKKDNVRFEDPLDPPTPKASIKSIRYSGTENHDKFTAPPESWKSPMVAKPPSETIDLKDDGAANRETSSSELKLLRKQFEEEIGRLHRTDLPTSFVTEYDAAFDLKAKSEGLPSKAQSSSKSETEYRSSFQPLQSVTASVSNIRPAGISEPKFISEKRHMKHPKESGIFQSKPDLSIETGDEGQLLTTEYKQRFCSPKGGCNPDSCHIPRTFLASPKKSTKEIKPVPDTYVSEYQQQFTPRKPEKEPDVSIPKITFSIPESKETEVDSNFITEYQQRYNSPKGGTSPMILEPREASPKHSKPFRAGPPFSEYQVKYDHLPTTKQADSNSIKPEREAKSEETNQTAFWGRKNIGNRNKADRAVAMRDKSILKWWKEGGKQMWAALNPITRFPRYNPFANLKKTPTTEYMESFKKFSYH